MQYLRRQAVREHASPPPLPQFDPARRLARRPTVRGHVRVLSAVAPIDELDQTGAGAGVKRVLAPLAVEGIACPPAAQPKLRDAIRIRINDPVGAAPRAPP